MSAPPISRFPVPTLAELPADIRARVETVQEKSGFVPNVFLAMAYRPDEFRAFFAYHDALMEKPGGLSKAQREMIVVATSAANQCHYCVVAHGAILRIRAKNPLIADQVAINYRKADLDARDKAMLDFAVKVAMTPWLINDADYAALTQHGFSRDEQWDIAAIAALFALSNRMANATDMRPNDEFYAMGREAMNAKRKERKVWVDPDDAPELTREWFESAEIWQGGKLIRPARPPSPETKSSSLRKQGPRAKARRRS